MLALKPVSTTSRFVAEEWIRFTLPVVGIAVSHVEALSTVAVQFNACVHAPVALIVTRCAVGLLWPRIPAKLRVAGVTEIAQAACTLKFTGICCGLPSTGLPAPSVPVMVMVPLYVLGMSDDRRVAVTVTLADSCVCRVPVAGVTVSHPPPTAVAAVADHVMVPPPVLVIVMVCAAGPD